MDYKLSRYACYLIVQNADSRKQVVALGQTYFAVQTRKQELTEKEYDIIDNIYLKGYTEEETANKLLVSRTTIQKHKRKA